MERENAKFEKGEKEREHLNTEKERFFVAFAFHEV